MSANRLIVVALGGNAISQPHEEGNVDEQFANSAATSRALVDLIEQGHQLVITHGNGPQIGNFLLRNEAAAGKIYALPMTVAVAHVQGGMGYMIAQALTNELARRGVNRTVATVVTTVLVDEQDPSFANPTKPIGRLHDREEADRYQHLEGWQFKEVRPNRYRRVVPSPQPKQIMELDTIRRLVEDGEILVACGGGGIPVVREPKGGLRGVRAIIDKDLAGAMLAVGVGADTFMSLTNVDRVCINFGKTDQRDVEHMTVDQARGYLDEGQFPAGSMGPKIQGAIGFLQNSDHPQAMALVGHLLQGADVLAGRAGTRITR